MGSWWRSEEMTYVSMVISEVAAPACVRELGGIGCIQFTDLNPDLPPFQRPYVNFIRRCDDIERKIRYVHAEVKKMDIAVQDAGSVNAFVDNAGAGEAVSSGSYILEGIEGKLDQYEQQLVELNKYGAKLQDEFNSKEEMHHVLSKARFLFSTEQHTLQDTDNVLHSASFAGRDSEAGISLTQFGAASASASATAEAPSQELTFSNICGVLPNEDRTRFERMLYRASRGNCWVRFVDIENSTDAGGPSTKCVFIIFFKSTSILNKIKKICDGFNARRYDVQSLDRPADLEMQQQANDREMNDARSVLDKNIDARRKICLEAALTLEEWLWLVRREKGIYHVLNMLKSDLAGNLLRGRGWIITSQIDRARSALNHAHVQANLPPAAILDRVPEVWPTPPTHFTTNKYTDAFQEFVNTYGIPRYREINPALFTAATFPFLFGVMYGDMGHGTCLMLFGLYLILTESNAEKRSTGEMMKGVYSARYMLFAMGLCAIYAGSVYNEYFSLSINFFGSGYDYQDRTVGANAVQIGTYGDPGAVYPYGVDPTWHISANNLLFFNSLKMKLAVILGITQMTGGVILRGINSVYFRQWLDFYCEFIPMMIFDLSFFGYMLILIFVKWSINWNNRMSMGSCAYDSDGTFGGCNLSTNTTCFTYGGATCDSTTMLVDMCPLGMGGSSQGCQPPNLITTLMNMALAPGSVDEPLYTGQAGVQTFLLLMAFFSVPVLLCAKPYILKKKHEEAQKLIAASNAVTVDALNASRHSEEDGNIDNPLLASLKAEAGTAKEDGKVVLGEGDMHTGAKDHGGAAASDAHGGGHGHGDEFNFGEIVIHQAIETIEFVLGMVSNTASYLRLWALSLAHSELAEVFWSKALLGAVSMGSPVAIYVGFAVFAAVTFAVLLAMDVLECFLHALRLHWVEFQNKFFRADGHKFQPFDFRSIIARALLE